MVWQHQRKNIGIVLFHLTLLISTHRFQKTYLDEALSWASNLAIITKDEISIIKHARKSVLFNDGKPWKKKDSNSLFDVTMGSYAGAEICELVGLFILNKLGQKFGKENIGLYRDDGLAIMKSKSARLADKTRKELHKCFEQFGLKITP